MINKLKLGPINPGLPVSQIEAISETQLYLALIAKLNECIDKINETTGYTIPEIVAAEFSTLSRYNIGDFVLYDYKLYKALTNITPGNFDATKWQMLKITDVLKTLANQITTITEDIDDINEEIQAINHEIDDINQDMEDLRNVTGSHEIIVMGWDPIARIYSHNFNVEGMTPNDALIIGPGEGYEEIWADMNPSITVENTTLYITAAGPLPTENIFINYLIVRC